MLERHVRPADTLCSRPTLPIRGSRLGGDAARFGDAVGGFDATQDPALAKEARLKNGIRVMMLPEHAFPVVALGVVLARGQVDAEPGVFDLFMDSMSSGNELISPKALKPTLYDYGAWKHVAAAKESSSVEVQVLSPVLRDVVRMVVTSFSAPTFDSDEFALLLDAHRRAATRMRDESAASAEHQLYELLYPPGHPYAQSVVDAPAPLAGVTLDTIRNMRPFIGADDVSVVAAGSFAEENLVALLEEALGRLRPGAKSRRVVEAPPPPTAPHVIAIDHPGDSQARIELGFMGVKYDDPDFTPLFVVTPHPNEREPGPSLRARAHLHRVEQHLHDANPGARAAHGRRESRGGRQSTS